MVCPFWKSAFPQLVSYNRFIEIMPSCLQALTTLFHQIKGKDTRISIIDSTKLAVCHNLRIQKHRVFKGLADRGESSTGWFYGFKLHLIINHLGEIINLKLTSGNVHDTAVIEQLTHELKGILVGDKGYLSKAKTDIVKQSNFSYRYEKTSERVDQYNLPAIPYVSFCNGQVKSDTVIEMFSAFFSKLFGDK